jgi:hypothetical protein
MEEREANGIITVPRNQLQSRAAEFGLDSAEVQRSLNSNKDEFFFTSTVPTCNAPRRDCSEPSGPVADLLEAINEQSSISEKMINVFNTEKIRNLEYSREIVAKHSAILEGLQNLESEVLSGIPDNASLERAYIKFCELMGYSDIGQIEFGETIATENLDFLGDLSSEQIENVLRIGPAVLSDNMIGTELLSKANLTSVVAGETLVVGNEWVVADKNRIETIGSMAREGSPVILSGGTPNVLSTKNTGLPSSFTGSGGVYGLWYDENTGDTYCYSSSGGDLKKAIKSAFEWVEDSKNKASMKSNSETRIPVLYSISSSFGSLGSLTVNTEHEKIGIQPGLYLVQTHYKLTGDAGTSTSFWDNWTAVADLRVSCQHSKTDLVAYSPDSYTATAGIQNVYLYYPDVEYEAEWTYNMSDSTFHDMSGNTDFSLWYDVNECQANDGNSYTIEPGTLAEMMDQNGVPAKYEEVEHYSVSLFRDRTILPDQSYTIDFFTRVTMI